MDPPPSPGRGRCEVAAAAVDYYLIVLRWTHFLAGITWIGLLYYFNFVQVPTFKELDAGVRNVLVPKLVRRALLWFRGSAVVTVLVGWTYFFSFWAINSFRSLTEWSWGLSILAGGILGTMMLLNVWGVIWLYQKKVIAATEAVLKGQPAPAEMPVWGKRAVIASRFNLVLSLPMLFFMASASHLAFI